MANGEVGGKVDGWMDRQLGRYMGGQMGDRSVNMWLGNGQVDEQGSAWMYVWKEEVGVGWAGWMNRCRNRWVRELMDRLHTYVGLALQCPHGREISRKKLFGRNDRHLSSSSKKTPL